MRRHAVILGASGSGKTETSMRIAYEVACKSEAPVFYLDAKGDREGAERFCSLMGAAGRRVRVFPNEPFDAWRGDWRGIANRLLEVIQFARGWTRRLLPRHRQDGAAAGLQPPDAARPARAPSCWSASTTRGC